MRELIFIQACPNDRYYIWQTHLWLESLRKIGKSDKAISLVFIPADRKGKPHEWQKLVDLYPESTFFFQEDEDNITRFLPFYIPILRPYVLSKYFKLHPELKEKAVFYCDADVYFTENFNIDKYLDDDICYVSDTLSYINADYFDRKINDALPSKIEALKKRDILDETCKLVGINREIAIKNNLNSGGAQYLLKGIDYTFWDKVFNDCLVIRKHLISVNKQYFQNENKGYQSWVADMLAVLWGLWYLNKETKIVPEMDFAWSSDPISKIDKVGIFHNAGITGHTLGEIPTFYKGDYVNNDKLPFNDPHLDFVYNNEESKKLCNWYYVSKIKELSQKYDINY